MLPFAPIWRRSPRLGKRITPHLQALCVLKLAGAARPPARRDTPWRGYGFFPRARVFMPDDPLHQPHDKLFRATFSNPVNAAAFLRHHLGGALPALVDWHSLTLLPGSFIDSEMAGSEADLLFSAKIGGSDARFYILWEHQRREAPLMGLRLLSYMVRIWKRQAGEGGPSVKLAPILPLVLAQDKDQWKTSSHFHELFAFPQGAWEAVRACTPDFAFRLLELVHLPYEDIRGTPEGILTLRSLKAEPLGELLHSLVWDSAVIASVSREAVERFFRYLLNANVDRHGFDEKVSSQHSANLTELAMTLAESIREEGLQKGLQKGRQEGRQEGRLEGRLEGLLEVLEVRFGSVPAGLAETLSSVSDLDRLKTLHRAALTCPDLESFASGL
jgi:predicted transposase YdaD